jgi:hypothetical protein
MLTEIPCLLLAPFVFCFCLLFNNCWICCILNTRGQIGIWSFAYLRIVLDQMILESHHHVGACGTCTIPNHEQNCNCTGSPCKEVSCPGQVLENLSWGLWQLRTCSGLWWYLLVWLEYSSGRGKQFPSRENGIHPSSWSSSAVSTPNLSTLPHRQMQPVASGPM